MMQQKRSPIFEQNSFMDFVPKRIKTDVPLSSKEKKEKFSERISALRHLVSPYGKTDAASVLLEAMEYINFLHTQVKVLSAPYLCSTPTAHTQMNYASLEPKACALCQFRSPLELKAATVPTFGLLLRPLPPILEDRIQTKLRCYPTVEPEALLGM